MNKLARDLETLMSLPPDSQSPEGATRHRLFYRLSESTDPEERLEDAAMWKALHDEYGDEIGAIRYDEERRGKVIFGRGRRLKGRTEGQPVSEHLPYWEDTAFLKYAGREFHVVKYENLKPVVAALHQKGLGAFVKSTRLKHAIVRVPIGTTVDEAFDALAYSFIDEGDPKLMAQEECIITYEHRFFVIDREIVTHSPIQPALTPLDYPLPSDAVCPSPREKWIEFRGDILDDLKQVAAGVAAEMLVPHAAVDCALLNGRPAVVEMNPMQIGQLGLYASDVRALANASRKLFGV